MYHNIITIILVVVSVLLMISVLLQNRGTGMGAVFGGEGAVYKTKRGAEKVLYWLTIIFAILFLGLSLTLLVV